MSWAQLAILAAMGAVTFGVSLVAAGALLRTNGLDDIRPVLPESAPCATDDRLLATDTSGDRLDLDRTASARLHAR